MPQLYLALLPEITLVGTACLLLLLGVAAGRRTVRQIAPGLALAALLAIFFYLASQPNQGNTLADASNTVRVFEFAHFIKLVSAGIGVLLVLLAWPTNSQATGNSALEVGLDVPEFLGLMLLSLAGIFLVASANDLILLFLGVELASIPTYIMVSISRPLPVAQEAGVKYFFLGAMAAALLLFGLSYLYGTSGVLDLHRMARQLAEPPDGPRGHVVYGSWQVLGLLLAIAGLSFKIAAVPLHFYAADVYQGAATPVTAFLSFVPKASGFVALIKILYATSGGLWMFPAPVVTLVWVLAVLTMCVGNTLGLLQFNVKRVLAYSSIAHSGYILVGLATLLSAGQNASVQQQALQGVLFYLAAYGIMNVGVFAVLMMLPAREDQPGTSAETFEDLAGQGRRHPGLGLAMAICCFSLIGLPLTVGFWGKLYLVRAALDGHLYGLVIITVLNAAISAAYYLRIVGAMFLRAEPATAPAAMAGGEACGPVCRKSIPLMLSLSLSAGAVLVFGTVPIATEMLTTSSIQAVNLEAEAALPMFLPARR